MAHPCCHCGGECQCDGLLIWIEPDTDCEGCEACREESVEQIDELDIDLSVPSGLSDSVRNIGRKHLEDPF